MLCCLVRYRHYYLIKNPCYKFELHTFCENLESKIECLLTTFYQVFLDFRDRNVVWKIDLIFCKLFVRVKVKDGSRTKSQKMICVWHHWITNIFVTIWKILYLLDDRCCWRILVKNLIQRWIISLKRISSNLGKIWK